jgi:6-phosphogluconolactonase
MSGLQGEREFATKASRRDFVKSTASFVLSSPFFAREGSNASRTGGGTHLAYVGTGSAQLTDTRGRGRGIYLVEMNPATGALTERDLFANDTSPTWLALDASGTHLYCVDNIRRFQGRDSGAASAYSIDRSSGHLTLLNTVSSEGAGPCYLSIHPSGKYAMVANYNGGTVAVLPIQTSGELGSATDVHRYKGPVGPKRAASAPPGSFAISGHDAPHAHMIQADPSGRYVLSTDLGTDKILIWKFDLHKGKLLPNPSSVSLPPGDGPRHFAFHPNGRWVYSLQEEGSTLVLFHFDGTLGTLTMKQSVSTLPKGFVGSNFCSDITVSPDGKFVYGLNRLHDSIAFFSIGAQGRVVYEGETWTRADYPCSLTIDPGGNFMFCCNEFGDSITSFSVNRKTGRPAFTGQYTPAGTPMCMVFLM